MILKISLRVKAGVPKTPVKLKIHLHSLYSPQNTLMLTESRGELSDLHSIRLPALRYCPKTSLLATIFSIISLCSAFNLPTGNKAKAFFNGRLEVILEFTPNTVDSHIAKGFLVSRDSKKERCVHCN